MSYSLLPYIFNSCWFISEGSVQGLLPVVKSIYKGEFSNIDHSEERARHRAYVVSSDLAVVSMGSEAQATPSTASKPNSIAVIPVMGVITLNDQRCGPEGTITKGQYLQESGRNPNIDSVILLMDTPGGEAHAMFNLTNSILEFKKEFNKPIVAYISSMAASAGYGIAACCDKIVCSDTHTIVGSIGTYITVIDQKKSLEAEGIFIEEIYAEDSTNKNIEWRAAIAGDKKPMLKMLKVFNDRFKSIVQTGRPELTKTDKGDPLSGQTIFAMDAIDMNLIDEIGNINVAVKHCIELTTNYSQTINSMTKFQTTWANIAAFFSNKKEGDDITDAEMVELNTELGTRKTSIDQLTGQITSKDAEIATLTQQLAEAKTGSDTLQAALTETETKLDAANAELAKRPGTTATAPKAETETINESSPKIISDPVNAVAKEMLGIQ